MAKNDEDRYVVPNKERGGWDVVKENHERSSGHFNTQREAIDRAREIVDNSGGGRGDVRIQGRNAVQGCLISTFHPKVSTTPGRARVIDQYVEHLVADESRWVTTAEEVARHVRKDRQS